MEKRKRNVPKGLRTALYKEDPNSQEDLKTFADADTGGGTLRDDPFANKDFMMRHQPRLGLPSEVNYTESRLGGSGDVLGEPIHEEDDPERAIMLMGVPEPEANYTMTVRLASANGLAADEYHVRCVHGVYGQLYIEKSKLYEVTRERAGMFFTVRVGKNQYETYQNINQADCVVLVKHSSPVSLNQFQMSFLALSNR